MKTYLTLLGVLVLSACSASSAEKEQITTINVEPSPYRIRMVPPTVVDNIVTISGTVEGPSGYGEMKCVTFDRRGRPMNSRIRGWNATPHWIEYITIANPRYPAKVNCTISSVKWNPGNMSYSTSSNG